MASRIEHRAEFDHGVGEVLAAQTGEPALKARIAGIGGPGSALLGYTAVPGGVRFTLRQGVPADKLPSVVRTLHSGDLFVDRQEEWTHAGGDPTGTVHATVSGVPGDITVRRTITAEGGRTVVRSTGEVKIRIPLVGGKLEGFVAGEITRLLAREAELTGQWLREQ